MMGWVTVVKYINYIHYLKIIVKQVHLKKFHFPKFENAQDTLIKTL